MNYVYVLGLCIVIFLSFKFIDRSNDQLNSLVGATPGISFRAGAY